MPPSLLGGFNLDNRDIMESSAGWDGGDHINDSAVHSAPAGKVFTAIDAWTDCTISALAPESASLLRGNTLVSAIIPHGKTLYGRFLSVTFTSGEAYAYLGV
jgi:hypothetical protein